MSDPTTPPEAGESLADRLRRIDEIVALRGAVEQLQTELRNAEDLICAVQAELLAGGSPARLRAIVGIKQETDTNAERS